ncbi:MAG: type II toxin-antitoxin system VapC family toxin [Chloroflexota bacterium]
MSIYLDSSAAVKLVFEEAESDALQRYLGDRPELSSSSLLRTELVRAAKRLDSRQIGRARRLLVEFAVREIDDEVLDRAGEIAPNTLRSPEAIHIATATLLGPDLDALVTYDRSMIEAARLYGLPVVSPG